jgi:RNA polymerase sigma-70 factor (ECF subfamily)
VSSRDAIVAEIPRLRRYARALTGHGDTLADDLVQDTLERALEKWRLWQRARLAALAVLDHAQPARRWPSPRRSRRFPRRGRPAAAAAAGQPAGRCLELRDLDRALALLPPDQREVLLLVGLEELSYAEVAPR